ncbi:MAG: hypothetical protein K2J82_07860 [Muribaculaceae bacterium]|nr:hypothetical protein [Muribaculaceae bacterium]
MATLSNTITLTRIKKGVDGKTYQPIRIRLWEDVPVNTSGTPSEDGYIWDGVNDGAPFTDVVYVRVNGANVYYRCIKNCTRVSGKQPSDSYYTGYLRQASSFDMVATKVLLAGNAVIDLLGTNAVNIFNGQGTLTGQVKGSAQSSDMMMWLGGNQGSPMFGVTGLGQVYFGGISGQHIEIDPVQKEMRVYDSSNNLVATHSGRDISLAEAVPNAGTTVTKSVAAGFSGELSSPGNANGFYTTEQKKTLSGGSAVATNGALKITVPSYSLSARVGKNDSSSRATMELRLQVHVNGSLKIDTPIASHSSTNSAAVYKTTTATTYTCPLYAGDVWQVDVVLRLNTYSSKGDSGTYTATSSSNIVVDFVAAWYRCHYGANGWVISYNSNNYEYCLVIGGKLHRKIVSNGNTILTT